MKTEEKTEDMELGIVDIETVDTPEPLCIAAALIAGFLLGRLLK